MTPTFTEQEPWERGFAAVFDREIVPQLPALEKERLAILGKRTMRLRLLAGVLVVVLGAIAAFVRPLETALVVSFFPLVLGLVGWILIVSASQDDFGARVKQTIIGPVAAFVGVVWNAGAAAGPDPAAFERTGLVGSYDRASLFDGMSGTHRGVEFVACEAHLTKRHRTTDSKGKSKTENRTVFQGVLASFSVPRPAPCLIVVRRDLGGLLNDVFGFFDRQFKGLHKVEIDDAAFEQIFEVRAEDPEAARDFVRGPFLQALVDIAATDGENNTRAIGGAFRGDRFYLSVSGLELVSVGPVTESVFAIEPRLHGTLREMTFPRRVVDRFYGL